MGKWVFIAEAEKSRKYFNSLRLQPHAHFPNKPH